MQKIYLPKTKMTDNKNIGIVSPVNDQEYSRYFVDLTRYQIENSSCDKHFQKELEFFLDYLKRHCPGNDLLEIGCGTGRILLFLAKEGYNCFGVDFDSMQIKNAKLIRDELGIRNLTLANVKIGEEIFGGKKFDAIISSDLVEHLPESELLRYFRQVHGVMNPKGIFLIQSKPLKFTYLTQKKFVLLILIFFFLPEKAFRRYLKFLDRHIPKIYKFFTRKNLQGTWQDKPPGHCNPPDDEIIRAQLEACGFEVREIRTSHAGTHKFSYLFRKIIKSKKLDTSISIYSSKKR